MHKSEIEELQEQMARASADIAYVRAKGLRGLASRSHARKTLYFAVCGDAVKIGVSSEPSVRLERLQTGAPGPLTLLAEKPNAGHYEAECHRRLKHLRLVGEWFRYTSEVDALILELPE